MMSKWLTCVVCLSTMVCMAFGFRPAGWFWNAGEWEWSSDENFWYWVPPGPPLIQNSTTQENLSRPVNGWIYYDWPYFYSLNEDTWFFIYQGNLPFVFRPSVAPSQQWTLWGSSTNPQPPPSVDGIDMVDVPGRSFEMEFVDDQGSGTDPFQNPSTATIRVDSFRIGQTEVTADLWDEVRNWAVQNGYDLVEGAWCSLEETGGASVPVAGLSWYDAVKWCNALSEMNGLTPVYYLDGSHQSVYRSGNENISNASVKWDANGFRLPTEAEWYLAAIGGGGTRSTVFAGGNTADTVAWTVNNSEGGPCDWGVGGVSPRAVGQKGAVRINGEPIYDLSGNMAEWVWNLQRENPGVPYADLDNPRGPNPGEDGARDERILRGGSWQWPDDAARIASYYTRSPQPGSTIFGFRVAQSGTR